MLYLRNHPPKLYNPLEDWNFLAGDPNGFYQVQVLYLIFKIINIIWTQPTYVIYLFSTPPNKVFCFCIMDIPLFPLFFTLTLLHVTTHTVSLLLTAISAYLILVCLQSHTTVPFPSSQVLPQLL